MPIVVVGGQRAQRDLRDIGDRARDLTPAWPKVGNMLANRLKGQFNTEGALFGTPWRKLKPQYKLWKLRHGFPGKILVQTGELKREFTSRPMAVEVYEKNRARFGSDSNKAVWHHYGTHKDGKQINPPRRILVMTRQNRTDAKDILKRYILSGR